MNIALEPGALRVWARLSLCWLFLYGCSEECPPGYDEVSGYCKVRAKDAGAHESSTDASTVSGGDSGASGGSGRAGTGSKTQNVSAAGADSDKGSGAKAATDAKSGGDAGTAVDAGGAVPANVASSDPCSGHPNETICVQAMMHHCDASGGSSAAETCSSAMLCQVGKTSGACATCSPGTYHCDGAKLNRCSDAGQYELAMTCSSEALCKESGACTDMLCKPNQKQCASDGTLKTCNADGSAFLESQNQVCGKDMCDARNGVCFACIPGAITCAGSSAVTCSADGQTMTMSECKAANDCSSVSCVEGAGCSAPMSLPAKTRCSSSGGQQCDGTGQCVGCVDDSVCGDKKCGARKTCVACTAASDCPGKSDCVDPVCNSDGTCTTAPVSVRACVDSQGNRGTCVAGACVCTPNCSGKCAGSDGCGKTCPNTCSADQMCQGTECVAKPTGHKMYEACTPSNELQGDCGPNLDCVGIGGRGYYCYQTPPCSVSQVSVFSTVCVQPCSSPDMTTMACPVAANYCFANNDTPDETDGWCIP